ncbi:MAG TPA: 50S ribosomal protein L11 methyltransferase [Chloroflexota bacterium]|nr:50S ribosomal protein L11 methyltransferase [Chloroflexota bacterium]
MAETPDADSAATAASDADEWLELATTVEPEAVESVAAAFAEHGQGVAIEQVVESSRDGDIVNLPADAPVLVKTYLPVRDPASTERRARLEMAVWALGQLRQVGPLQVRTLREADWANAWKEYFFVHRVGRRTVIVPSWRQGEYDPRSDDIVLLLDPGMAFGTGLHPTTRLCLRAAEDLVQPGHRVLDVGAGSGILAIAAARLGARHVLAVELEPVAAAVCAENVERNGVADVVTVQAGTLSSEPASQVDVILANITIATLLQLHPLLWAHLRPGGVAVLSGVLAERSAELLAVLLANGWEHERTEQEQDWVAIYVHRP